MNEKVMSHTWFKQSACMWNQARGIYPKEDYLENPRLTLYIIYNTKKKSFKETQENALKKEREKFKFKLLLESIILYIYINFSFSISLWLCWYFDTYKLKFHVLQFKDLMLKKQFLHWMVKKKYTLSLYFCAANEFSDYRYFYISNRITSWILFDWKIYNIFFLLFLS